MVPDKQFEDLGMSFREDEKHRQIRRRGKEHVCRIGQAARKPFGQFEVPILVWEAGTSVEHLDFQIT